MAKFRFRLEASLRISEQVLDEVRQKLAEKIYQWQVCAKETEQKRDLWQQAVNNQRTAGMRQPESLGQWQIFVFKLLQDLRQLEKELKEKEKTVEETRRELVEANREVEKFKRLKEKLKKRFFLEEQRRDQLALDEAGQIRYWHQKRKSI